MFNQLPAQKKKNYVAYKKIASFRKGLKPTESGGRHSSCGSSLHAFEHENGITFSCRYRGREWSGKTEFQDYFKYKLQIRTLKSGDRRFIFYSLLGRPAGVRTASPNHMRSKLGALCREQERARKNPRTAAFERGLYKAQEQRLLIFLRAFLRRQGISLRGLSGDPFSLMVQLCYPGAFGFDEKVLQQLSVGEFVLDDPLKLALRTKGKASKRLLYGAIKRFPSGSQTILKIAKYLRINRSLDEAQKFLELLNEAPATDANGVPIHCAIDDGDYFEYSEKKLTAKQMRVFDPLSVESIRRLIANHQGRSITNDTFAMIEQLNGNDGFNVLEIQYKTIRELHDALTALRPRRGKNNFANYEFDQDEAPMQFCKTLAENFSDEEYSLCYPAGTKELRDYASVMRNCAFYYHERIKKGEYAIFCFKKERLEIMFGVTFHTKRMMRDDQQWISDLLVKADQIVGYCNGKIDRAIEDRLNLRIEQAVKGSFSFWHRTPPVYEDWLPQNFA